MSDLKSRFMEFCEKAFVCEDIGKITRDLEKEKLLNHCDFILQKSYAQKVYLLF